MGEKFLNITNKIIIINLAKSCYRTFINQTKASHSGKSVTDCLRRTEYFYITKSLYHFSQDQLVEAICTSGPPVVFHIVILSALPDTCGRRWHRSHRAARHTWSLCLREPFHRKDNPTGCSHWAPLADSDPRCSLTAGCQSELAWWRSDRYLNRWWQSGTEDDR